MDKPVFILIPGLNSTNLFWKYEPTGKSLIRKLNFFDKLKKLGDIYEHKMDFYNIIYYNTLNNINDNNKKDYEKIIKIYKKYNAYDLKLNFKIEDLYYENICKNIHNNIIKLFGKNRKYILVCHSAGGQIGLLYSKIYKKECLFNIMIDSMITIPSKKIPKEIKNSKKIIDEYLYDNNNLKNILTKIKNIQNGENINKEIGMIFELITYYQCYNEPIKHYNNILLPIYTVFFRAYNKEANNKRKKIISTEQKILKKNNSPDNFEYILMPDAEHYIWYDQKYSNDIINKIKQLIVGNIEI